MIPISKPYIGPEEKANVLEVLDSGMLVQGAKVAELEEKFTQLCGVDHAIACTSGTIALHMALMAHNIGPGDEVITSPFTFIASVNSIFYVGATPVLVDIEADTFNLDPTAVEAAITPRTKAIMPVHLYGYPCDMDAFQAIADKHNLIIIEDAAQSIGATYKGQMTGSFGTGCFSLYATKNIMSGEGGMITTNNAELAQKMRMLRNHGMERRYYHEFLGYNFRMTNLHGAIGCAQMDRLADFTAKRRHNAAYLNAHLQGVITPSVKPDYGHVWHQYTIRIPDEMPLSRDEAVKKLTEAGIGTGIFYPVPAHKQAYIEHCLGEKALPITDKLAEQVISLPVHPQLSQADLEKIVTEVNNLC